MSTPKLVQFLPLKLPAVCTLGELRMGVDRAIQQHGVGTQCTGQEHISVRVERPATPDEIAAMCEGRSLEDYQERQQLRQLLLKHPDIRREM